MQKTGFNVDYNKSEKYFYAKNADGYGVTVEYEGYNIMLIRMNSPDENDSLEDDITVTEKQTESTTQNTTTTKTTTLSTTAPTIVDDEIAEDDINEYEDNETTTKKKHSRIVYTTPYGEKYHYSKSCAGKNASESELDDVKGFLDPCKKCVG